MVVRDAWPGCGSTQFKKSDDIYNGKQKHRREACGRRFVVSAHERVISDEHRTLIEHLLRERVSLRGICRAVGVSPMWLLRFTVDGFASCPERLCVRLPGSPTDVMIRQLEAEADEVWSVVQKKTNEQRIWIAVDAKMRQTIAFPVGNRSRDGAKELTAKIPLAYREQATFHTDQHDAYTGVVPVERHKAITKYAGKTTRIERFS